MKYFIHIGEEKKNYSSSSKRLAIQDGRKECESLPYGSQVTVTSERGLLMAHFFKAMRGVVRID